MAEPRTHHLKTHPAAFAAVLDGRKAWEFRRNDRDFQVGDVLELEFYDPAPDDFVVSRSAGHQYIENGPDLVHITAHVTYILHGGQFGIPVGFCVMSIEVETAPEPTAQARKEE